MEGQACADPGARTTNSASGNITHFLRIVEGMGGIPYLSASLEIHNKIWTVCVDLYFFVILIKVKSSVSKINLFFTFVFI